MVHQVIRFNNEGFRLWKSEFDSNEESYRDMGLTESPKVYCSDEGKDDVAVVLTWNNMKDARQYVTNANFTRLSDEGQHDESLRDYISQTHLEAIDEAGVIAMTRLTSTAPVSRSCDIFTLPGKSPGRPAAGDDRYRR